MSAAELLLTPREDLHAPQQARSRATRDRILAALARLLKNKPFDAISTAELTRAANCSMSSLYARFPTKDALLSALHDRFFEYSVREVGTALRQIDADDALPLRERVRRLISFFISSYRQHRGLLRSLISQDGRRGASPFAARTRTFKQLVFERSLAVVLQCDPRTAELRTIRAFRFALWLVVLAIEQVVLLDKRIGSERVDDETLTEELAKVFVARIAITEEQA